MAKQHTMNVSLTPLLAREVASRVKSGRYATASEVVREGLRLLRVQERDRAAAYRELRRSVREAHREVTQSGGLSGDEVLARARKRIYRRKRAA